MSSEARRSAFQNSNYYSTKFIVSTPDTYGGKEGNANNQFPKSKDWDANQIQIRREYIKKYVKVFTLGFLEKSISTLSS